MGKWILLAAVLCTLGFDTPVDKTAAKGPRIETIVFMRHGEKPLLDFGQLNCQGLNRVLALPNVLNEKFGKPDYIFAPNPYLGGFFYYVRALATIEPTAIQLGLPVQTDFAFYQVSKVAHALLEPQYHSSLLFVAWEHLNIVFIAKKIVSLLGGGTAIPNWPDDDYDSLYVISIDWEKIPPAIKFTRDHQGLDNQSKICRDQKDADNTTTWGTDTFVFIPEAEPVTADFDQLSCQGLNRALALPKVLNNIYPTINQFVLPKPNERKPSNFRRAFMTIEPTIINRGGLFIPAGETGIKAMVEFLQSDVCLDQTTVITWPKRDMANLVRALYKQYKGNPNEIPNPVDSNDTIYQITVVHSLSSPAASFKILQQKLDNQPSKCPT